MLCGLTVNTLNFHHEAWVGLKAPGSGLLLNVEIFYIPRFSALLKNVL